MDHGSVFLALPGRALGSHDEQTAIIFRPGSSHLWARSLCQYWRDPVDCLFFLLFVVAVATISVVIASLILSLRPTVRKPNEFSNCFFLAFFSPAKGSATVTASCRSTRRRRCRRTRPARRRPRRPARRKSCASRRRPSSTSNRRPISVSSTPRPVSALHLRPCSFLMKSYRAVGTVDIQLRS